MRSRPLRRRTWRLTGRPIELQKIELGKLDLQIWRPTELGKLELRKLELQTWRRTELQTLQLQTPQLQTLELQKTELLLVLQKLKLQKLGKQLELRRRRRQQTPQASHLAQIRYMRIEWRRGSEPPGATKTRRSA